MISSKYVYINAYLMCLHLLHNKHIRTKIMQIINKYLDQVSWEVYRSEESGSSLIRAEQVVEAGN
jgi:hypothetical protein